VADWPETETVWYCGIFREKSGMTGRSFAACLKNDQKAMQQTRTVRLDMPWHACSSAEVVLILKLPMVIGNLL
jgi:hypothetical protein